MTANNVISLSGATVTFKVVAINTRGAKSHYGVKIEFTPTFQSRDEYLAFRKDWKTMYMGLSQAIRTMRKVRVVVCQNPALNCPIDSPTLWSTSQGVSSSLFAWRMHAKALLVALQLAKVVAGQQRNIHVCPHCLDRQCSCVDADVMADMGAKG